MAKPKSEQFSQNNNIHSTKIPSQKRKREVPDRLWRKSINTPIIMFLQGTKIFFVNQLLDVKRMQTKISPLKNKSKQGHQRIRKKYKLR